MVSAIVIIAAVRAKAGILAYQAHSYELSHVRQTYNPIAPFLRPIRTGFKITKNAEEPRNAGIYTYPPNFCLLSAFS